MSSPSNKEKRNHNGGFNRCFLSSVADVACVTPSFSVVGRVYYDARCTGFEINITEYISASVLLLRLLHRTCKSQTLIRFSDLLKPIPSVRSSARSRGSLDHISFSADVLSPRRTGPPASALRHGSRADSDRTSASQKEIPDEVARLIYINDPARTNESVDFAGNSIRTAKYSILTFLPRNLFEQFHRLAYIYFLVIAILNQLPQLAVFGRGASILPLAFVLFVTAVKDAYEDYRRHRSDRVENNRTSPILSDHGDFLPKRWKDIRVGEIIKIQSNESLPCDIVLLSTSDPTGVAYVQTINLDGESNLKTRYAKQETIIRAPEKQGLAGMIRCETPNRNIYGFHAYMEIDGKGSPSDPQT
ncbi:hypothetical protein HPP92_001712 [Vanilla planifolia]|uniref:P-type ATPase N-terminal domain-containing protein n=1 Tax=Vanilla planifolia TaxID=51239 RepID=A0A835VHT2_VANPL|nr:hypothetical protein HPP92_001712 [Vanilla planifolia]